MDEYAIQFAFLMTITRMLLYKDKIVIKDYPNYYIYDFANGSILNKDPPFEER